MYSDLTFSTIYGEFAPKFRMLSPAFLAFEYELNINMIKSRSEEPTRDVEKRLGSSIVKGFSNMIHTSALGLANNFELEVAISVNV